MSRFILNEFQEWFTVHNRKLQTESIVAVLSELPKTNKLGRFVDPNTKKHIDRITLWVTGECDLEVLEIAIKSKSFGNIK